MPRLYSVQISPPCIQAIPVQTAPKPWESLADCIPAQPTVCWHWRMMALFADNKPTPNSFWWHKGNQALVNCHAVGTFTKSRYINLYIYVHLAQMVGDLMTIYLLLCCSWFVGILRNSEIFSCWQLVYHWWKTQARSLQSNPARWARSTLAK